MAKKYIISEVTEQTASLVGGLEGRLQELMLDMKDYYYKIFTDSDFKYYFIKVRGGIEFRPERGWVFPDLLSLFLYLDARSLTGIIPLSGDEGITYEELTPEDLERIKDELLGLPEVEKKKGRIYWP